MPVKLWEGDSLSLAIMSEKQQLMCVSKGGVYISFVLIGLARMFGTLPAIFALFLQDFCS